MPGAPLPRHAPRPLWLLCGLALAARAAPPPILDDCADPAHALVLTTEGLGETQRRAVEAEMQVEGARLGLQVCRNPLPGALVTTRVSATSALLRLEALNAGHVVGRELPLPAQTQQAALETALILGDLVREALDQPSTEPPPGWSVGARGAFDAFPLSQGWLFGGDAVLRRSWGRVGLELLAGARGSRRFDSAEGSISLLAAGGGLFLLVSLAHPGRFEVLLTAGARAQALRLDATSTGAALAHPRWVPVIDARAGLLFELGLGPVTLSLGAGAAEPILGALATAGGLPVTGVFNLGFFTSLGLAVSPGGAP